jgi:FkbM family methyltransferase
LPDASVRGFRHQSQNYFNLKGLAPSSMLMREHIKKALLHLGYEIRRAHPERIGRDPFNDMRRLTDSEGQVILFDVGANRGQTVASFRVHFPSSIIHAFEPSPSTFEHLKRHTAGIQNLHLRNIALGANCERKTLIENPQDTVSSLLSPGKDYRWENVSNQTDVDVRTIDNYCDVLGITHIDILKSDTQGFEYEVLKGGLDMLRHHKIHLIYIEMNFLDLYVGMPHFEEIYAFLKDLGFELVSFYNITWQESRLGWLDGLFIDPQWKCA